MTVGSAVHLLIAAVFDICVISGFGEILEFLEFRFFLGRGGQKCCSEIRLSIAHFLGENFQSRTTLANYGLVSALFLRNRSILVRNQPSFGDIVRVWFAFVPVSARIQPSFGDVGRFRFEFGHGSANSANSGATSSNSKRLWRSLAWIRPLLWLELANPCSKSTDVRRVGPTLARIRPLLGDVGLGAMSADSEVGAQMR